MLGPGKYDAILTRAREEAGARAGILIILDGTAGAGFSCQTDLEAARGLPELLRQLADQIEEDLRESLPFPP